MDKCKALIFQLGFIQICGLNARILLSAEGPTLRRKKITRNVRPKLFYLRYEIASTVLTFFCTVGVHCIKTRIYGTSIYTCTNKIQWLGINLQILLFLCVCLFWAGSFRLVEERETGSFILYFSGNWARIVHADWYGWRSGLWWQDQNLLIFARTSAKSFVALGG